MGITPIDQKLKTLLNNPEMADVQFIVGKERIEIYGHKLLLSVSSPIWKTMFYSSKWKEVNNKMISKVEIPDIDPESFLSILEFAYTRKIKITPKTALNVLHAADKFLMKELKEATLNHILKNLNNRTSLNTYERALDLKEHQLIEITLRYIETHAIEIFSEQRCLCNLKDSTIQTLLRSDKLLISEIEIFRRVIERGSDLIKKRSLPKTAKNLKECLLPILPLIRLDLIEPRGLEEVSRSKLYNYEYLFSILVRVTIKNQIRYSTSRKALKIKPLIALKTIRALLLGADSEENVEDVTRSIKSTGINNLDFFDISRVTPKLKDIINKYDAIFIFTNAGIKDPVKIGNLLASFVEHGGGLVVCAAYALVENSKAQLKGRIITENFLPTKPGKLVTEILGDNYKLDSRSRNNHPILKNARTFYLGRSNEHIQTKLIENEPFDDKTIIVEKLQSDNPLIMVKKREDFGSIVVLNFYPVSNSVFNGGWLSSTDGAIIIANSVEYVANF
ncbi:btb (poz) domain-containing 2a-related [Anaeramoeba flamelloides]|uniref:Btb (Poz) domain-containing 2a-related n=1 Tax=Anaeramoeba flamelloides TaxID=1746091 RepID=A0AAV7ZAC3_9EUKA|nr:btb (poz) domain-containing 2a-related [Anaeramoeba flamelloides]